MLSFEEMFSSRSFTAMRLLFATDLHQAQASATAFSARLSEADLLILGGDLTLSPVGGRGASESLLKASHGEGGSC